MDRTFYNEGDLRAFAGRFALKLRRGDVVGLSGPLGSGKTTFVKAAVEAISGCDAATSPTFTFWHRYEATIPIDHLDFYRVETAGEAANLGVEEAFDGRSIVFVEWPENAPELLPSARFSVELQGKGAEPRTIAWKGPRELHLEA